MGIVRIRAPCWRSENKKFCKLAPGGTWSLPALSSSAPPHLIPSPWIPRQFRTRMRSGKPFCSSASTTTWLVRYELPPVTPTETSTFPQTKTIELMSEANHCIEDLFRANKDIRAVASMTDKYRKNVRYNIAREGGSD
jgi:hypothetical protein